MSGLHDDLIADLTRVVEAIDERSFDQLREAAAAGVKQRPDSDRYLTQARRAIEKAIQALERAGGAPSRAIDPYDVDL